PSFERDVVAALHDADVGAVHIEGVEPGIRLLALRGEADDLALVPVRSGESAAGAPVIPLAATAALSTARQTSPVERHDGVAAVRWIVYGPRASLDRVLASLRRGRGRPLAIEP